MVYNLDYIPSRHITRVQSSPVPRFPFFVLTPNAQCPRPHPTSVLSDVVCPSHLSSLWATPCDLDRICDCKLCAVVRMPHWQSVGATSPSLHILPILYHPISPSPSTPTWLASVHRLFRVCIPKTTAEFKTIIVVYILAWLRQRGIE